MNARDPLEALRLELADLDPAALAALTTPIAQGVKSRIVAGVRSEQRTRSMRRKCSLAGALAACVAALWLANAGGVDARPTEEAARLTRQAESLRDQHRYDQAEQLLQRALEIRERTLGPEHIEVAANLTELAELYRSQRQSEKAKPLYRRAFAIQPTAVF